MHSPADSDLAAGGPPQVSEAEENRQHERYPVRLAVRYASAQDYVQEYAENLSEGGLFIGGAQHLEALDVVNIHVELPGFGTYEVETRVAHVMSDERSAETGRRAGAGLAIMDAPPGFREALSEYLILLGKRHDAVVFVVGEGVCREVESAGYRVQQAPPPILISEAVSETRAVIGLVVPVAEIESYKSALDANDLPDLIIPLDGDSSHGTKQLDAVLHALDQRVLHLHRSRQL